MIRYRLATPADGPALNAMARQSWVETFGAQYTAEDLAAFMADAYGPEGALIRSLSDPQVAIRLAEGDNGIAGYATIAPNRLPAPDAEPGAQDVRQLYVLRPWQGSGVAAQLMAWAIGTARERGAPALYLSVWEENGRARRFYQRHGFVHVGDYDFPVGNQIDRDLVMRLAL